MKYTYQLKGNLFEALLGVVVLGSIVTSADTLPKQFQVIPQPREVELLNGTGLSFGDLKAISLEGGCSRPVMGSLLSYLPQTDTDGKGVLSLERRAVGTVFDSAEGYILIVSAGNARVRAQGESGLFYGCQTLEQLLEDARDTGVPIPACKIKDYPAFLYRAVHFDIKHHLDSVNYYYNCIDRLAHYKVNAIIFEFEDKLRYRRQPLVGAPHAISIEEMATLTNYARERHIEISPLVQGLGHVTFILKHPEYAHLREDPNSGWCFCPIDEEVYKVQFDLYRDAMEATPGSRYLHVGGDEIGQIGLCPRCKPTADKEGTLALNLYWLNRVCEFVTAQGRTPIFWDDMIFEHAGLYESVHQPEAGEAETAEAWKKGEPLLDALLARFPKDCVYMRWDYSTARQPGNLRALDWYRDHGLKVMIATAAQAMSALFPESARTLHIRSSEFRDDRVRTIQSFVQVAAEKGIDGHLCTAWDDSSPHFETYWRGLIASAEYGWSPTGRSLDEYMTAYLQREFGPECSDANGLAAQLYLGTEFWRWGLFFDNAERVHTIPPEKEQKLIDVPDLTSPGAWSRRHVERLSIAQQEVMRHDRLAVQLADLIRKARRNRYCLQVFAATNDFQVMPARLLLALQASDVADSRQQQVGMKDVHKALDDFDGAWKTLKMVYSKTRFLGNPPNYVKGTYTNVWPDIPYLAAQQNDLSWLIMPEEKYHRRVRDWLAANGG
jgi:hexosaminidase